MPLRVFLENLIGKWQKGRSSYKEVKESLDIAAENLLEKCLDAQRHKIKPPLTPGSNSGRQLCQNSNF